MILLCPSHPELQVINPRVKFRSGRAEVPIDLLPVLQPLFELYGIRILDEDVEIPDSGIQDSDPVEKPEPKPVRRSRK